MKLVALKHFHITCTQVTCDAYCSAAMCCGWSCCAMHMVRTLVAYPACLADVKTSLELLSVCACVYIWCMHVPGTPVGRAAKKQPDRRRTSIGLIVNGQPLLQVRGLLSMCKDGMKLARSMVSFKARQS